MQQEYISSKTKLLGLFGNPARHSLSPIIHNEFLKNTGIDAVYLTFEFPHKNLKDVFSGAAKLGFIGLNITMPFKEDVFRLTDKNDKRSSQIGSVNTVKFKTEKNVSIGFNTDVDGFVRSLDDIGFNWRESNCLIIGAGGAAKSSVFALIEKKVKKIFIYNRTIENAQKIKNSLSDNKIKRISIIDKINDLDITEIGLICNCTPIGMDISGKSGILPIPDFWDLKNKILFEMIYKPVDTALVKKGRKDGARIIDGLDMLINQAVSSFNVWFNVHPGTKRIRKTLIDCLDNKN